MDTHDARSKGDPLADDAERSDGDGEGVERPLASSTAHHDPAEPEARRSGVSMEELAPVIMRLDELARELEGRLSRPYRDEAFRLLAPSVAGLATSADGGRSRTKPADAIGRSRLDLSPYSAVLDAPGRNLMKALAALDVARRTFEIAWMTPSEIERFLIERASVRGVYRTNLSNALRGGRGLVDRRRRGRAYEYRLTARGATALDRELSLLSAG